MKPKLVANGLSPEKPTNESINASDALWPSGMVSGNGGTPWMNLRQEMNDDLKRQSNGQITFRFYAGGVAGDERDVQENRRSCEQAIGQR